ncbi:MAG: helix-turn-helix domain-containing protein [Anaerolineae bacterium]
MSGKTISYELLKERSLSDPQVREAYEALEPAYQVACLRIERGMSQEELARRAGTHQPSVARLESGRSTPSLRMLRRLAEALDARLVVRIEPK